MTPTFAALNVSDLAAMQAVLLSQRQSLLRACSNFGNLRFSDFGTSMLFSTQHTMSAFPHRIARVVPLRPQKQMSRICAGWIVALVQHVKTGWNWAVVNFPRKTSCQFCSLGDAHYAVPVGFFVGSPLPAFSKLWTVFWKGTVLRHFFPKSFLPRFVFPTIVFARHFVELIHFRPQASIGTR